MDLFLLRHGIAAEWSESSYASDSERPLTQEGIDKLKKIVQSMRQIEIGFNLILSSPYLRSKQTAEIVASAYKMKIQYSENLVPEADLEDAIKEIRKKYSSKEKILLVGHEPFMSSLISLLISGDTETSISLKKGGLAKIHTEDLKYGQCGELIWLFTPKQMIASAKPSSYGTSFA